MTTDDIARLLRRPYTFKEEIGYLWGFRIHDTYDGEGVAFLPARVSWPCRAHTTLQRFYVHGTRSPPTAVVFSENLYCITRAQRYCVYYSHSLEIVVLFQAAVSARGMVIKIQDI